MSKRSCASITPKGAATTSTKPASKFSSMNVAGRNSAGWSRRSLPASRSTPKHWWRRSFVASRHSLPRRLMRLCPSSRRLLADAASKNPAFARWARTNTRAHKVPGYAIAVISLKPTGGAPGDATADQMRIMADAAEAFSLGELRVSAEQNIILPYVKKDDLFKIWQMLEDRWPWYCQCGADQRRGLLPGA